MSAIADDLTIEALAQSEAELVAIVNELHRDIAVRDEMISVLLDQIHVALKTVDRLRAQRRVRTT